MKEWFNTSNYHKDMVLPDEYKEKASVNKNVIGKMKNELGKGHMSEFIAISPEVYAYKQIQVDGTVSEDKKARNKIALKNNENKRLKSFNGITTYPYGTSTFIVWIEQLNACMFC